MKGAPSEMAYPIGPEVNAAPAKRPERTTLQGRLVTLTPLDPVAHGDALFDSHSRRSRRPVVAYLFEGPFPNRARLRSRTCSERPPRKTLCSSRFWTGPQEKPSDMPPT